MAAREWPQRKLGDNDPVVRTIQHLLNSAGAAITPDAAFGEATEAAVKAFQAARSLVADGVVGRDTWESVVVDLRIGDRSDAVKALQVQLYIRGTLPAVDGIYSMKTDISVRRFQVVKQLRPDGVAGIDTWHALVSDTDLPAISKDLRRDDFDWQAKLRSMLRPEG